MLRAAGTVAKGDEPQPGGGGGPRVRDEGSGRYEADDGVLAPAFARPPFEPELDDESLLEDSLEVESLVEDSSEDDELEDSLEESDSRSLCRPLALEPWSFL